MITKQLKSPAQRWAASEKSTQSDCKMPLLLHHVAVVIPQWRNSRPVVAVWLQTRTVMHRSGEEQLLQLNDKRRRISCLHGYLWGMIMDNFSEKHNIRSYRRTRDQATYYRLLDLAFRSQGGSSLPARIPAAVTSRTLDLCNYFHLP